MKRARSVAACSAAWLVLAGFAGFAGCAEEDNQELPRAVRGTDSNPPPSDLHPEKLDGTESNEFEAEDIEAAENASPEVQEYCSGAVSEAQYEGCLSHVTEVP